MSAAVFTCSSLWGCPRLFAALNMTLNVGKDQGATGSGGALGICPQSSVPLAVYPQAGCFTPQSLGQFRSSSVLSLMRLCSGLLLAFTFWHYLLPFPVQMMSLIVGLKKDCCGRFCFLIFWLRFNSFFISFLTVNRHFFFFLTVSHLSMSAPTKFIISNWL